MLRLSALGLVVILVLLSLFVFPNPVCVLVTGVAFIISAITVFKLHAFFALLLAAVLVGVLSPKPLESTEKDAALLPQATRAVQLSAKEFGNLAGKIGIVIALAAIIGVALMESGAADKITRRLLAFLGEKRANYALLGSGYFLSVPVFFDTVFFLLVPLARALRMRTGRHYLAYILAICAGGAVTHSIVPPTPGPLAMASILDIKLAVAIFGGFLLGLPVAVLGGIFLPKLLVRWVDPPVRDAPGSSQAELEAIVNKAESELPGFWASVMPVLLPIVLITVHSIVKAMRNVSDSPESYDAVYAVTSFLGDKLFALSLGTGVALWVLLRHKRYSLQQLTDSLEPGLMAAGIIILITCAGGSFGAMLGSTGLADEIKGWLGEGKGGLLLILMAWGIAAVMKIAQGSGTVSMIVSAGIMWEIIEDMELSYHRIYIFAAIAFGSKFISWMNDSGFWVVCKMSGFTEKETLKTWTVLLGFMGVVGLAEVLVLAWCLPFPFTW
ncbi:MAG: SLC13 family permease [Planctomycetota bacterium]|nr:SLC13 family permease [Planctomycetota bacterium]